MHVLWSVVPVVVVLGATTAALTARALASATAALRTDAAELVALGLDARAVRVDAERVAARIAAHQGAR